MCLRSDVTSRGLAALHRHTLVGGRHVTGGVTPKPWTETVAATARWRLSYLTPSHRTRNQTE
jgi:hypothetical protein